MSKSCYWGLNLSFFLAYLFLEGDGEGLLKVMQLKQHLLSAAGFHGVDRSCSWCRCGGQWLLWKERGSIPCIPCSSSCHCPVPCAFFPLLSPPQQQSGSAHCAAAGSHFERGRLCPAWHNAAGTGFVICTFSLLLILCFI